MKKVLVSMMVASAVAGAMSLAVAGGPDNLAPANVSNAGIYVDGNAGYGWDVGQTGITTATALGAPVSSTNTNGRGFAYDVNGGYQFNDYVGVEMGYLSLPNSSGNFMRNLDGVDLAVKGIYPVTDSFDVFGKAGVARMSASLGATATSAAPGTIGLPAITFNAPQKSVRYTGIFAVGVDYKLTSNLSAILSGVTTLKNNPLPATYMATAGLGYKFAI